MKRLALTVALLACGSIAWAQDSEPGKVIDSKANRSTAEMAKKILAQAKDLEEPEEHLVGIGGECHVDSRVDHYIRVYINGRYRGTIPPWGDIFPFVGDGPHEVTHLYAVTTCGRYSWSRSVYGDHGDFHWILRP